jgi:hypothetical protein
MMAVSALIFLVLRNLDFKPFNWLAP